MMWFLNVLLTSKSICLISVEKVWACCFIFWRAEREDMHCKNQQPSELKLWQCPHFKGTDIIFRLHTSYFPSLSCLTFSTSKSKAQAWPLSCRGMPLYTRFTNWNMWKRHSLNRQSQENETVASSRSFEWQGPNTCNYLLALTGEGWGSMLWLKGEWKTHYEKKRVEQKGKWGLN